MGERSEGAGVVLGFERAAMNGEPMPSALRGVERVQYLCLRNLYRLHRTGAISREEAAQEKKKMLAEFADAQRMLEFDTKWHQHTVALWAGIGASIERYRAERTLENADEVIKAIFVVKGEQ